MAALTDAANVLRKAGLDVHELPGWQTAGEDDGPFTPIGIMAHHDAMALGFDSDPANDLNVPLYMHRKGVNGAQLWVSRTGLWVTIAAGRKWHAGLGGPWRAIGKNNGNSQLVGMETDHTDGTPWTDQMMHSIYVGTRALAQHYGWDAKNCPGHKEYAPTRKHDPSGFDLDAWRHYIAGGGSVKPPTPQAPGKSYIVQAGDTLWAIAKTAGCTASQIAALSGITNPDLILPGQRLILPSGATRPAAAKPQPPKSAPAKHGPMFGVPVPTLIRKGSGQYYGPITGPARSHGGYYVSERADVRLIQRQLIWLGMVPGITDTNSKWADGRWEKPTTDAMARFQAKYLAKTTSRYGECWYDDWEALAKH